MSEPMAKWTGAQPSPLRSLIPAVFGFTQNVTVGPIEVPAMYSSGRQTFPRPPIMVNPTGICRIAISIGILMTLSSSVPQTTREKVSIETVYADRVENVYPDRVALPSSQPSEAYYCDSSGCIRCDSRGDCIRDRIALPPSQPSHEDH